MKYKYQLVTLGSNAEAAKEILNLFDERFKELNLPIDAYKCIDRNNFQDEYMGNQPCFVFYFGNIDGNHEDLELTDLLIKDGSMILPIYFNDESFSREIPGILANQNGIQYNEIEREKIVSTALESFGLLRSERKVFISYRRSESTSVAIQLFESLEAHNFDVFLDTHSVPKGAPFQDELWHRMTDCDVIVLLNTPDFSTSYWCKEEFAEAGAKQIGIVQLVWPHHDLKDDSTTHISYPKQLTESDFEDDIYNDKDKSKLKQSVINELIKDVESIRARNLAARQDSLITDFRNIASSLGKTIVVQPERFLTEELPLGKRRIFIPTIGIPQSTSCQTAEIKNEMSSGKVSIRLIYDDLRIREKWIEHLDWLNKNLNIDVKTLKKQEFKSWLQNN
ncbi:hypothetical protein GCM10028824_42750 [Hymenobacter segetis]|uniref:Toll/interleukin-1 receptor domain-containing protein n=1 Tax=Hymenobacter segetis TaxID=2025509 RepID=A0ABU9LZY3_9BACT